MITPEQVPENVWVEVTLRLESFGCLIPDNVAKLIVAEAINAWKGMEPHKVLTVRDNGEGYDLKQIGIILPLSQET